MDWFLYDADRRQEGAKIFKQKQDKKMSHHHDTSQVKTVENS